MAGEYTLVFEHAHEQVGLRAAALALEAVQQAFDGTLETVEPAVVELRALAETPDTPPLHADVLCGVTGGDGRAEAQQALRERLQDPDELVIDVSPNYLLQAGLPYARSRMAIILDADLNDVPPRYQEEERAIKLVNVLCDAVRREGLVVCPAKAWEIQDYARESGCRIAVFAIDDRVTQRDTRRARAVAMVRDGRHRHRWLRRCERCRCARPVPARRAAGGGRARRDGAREACQRGRAPHDLARRRAC